MRAGVGTILAGLTLAVGLLGCADEEQSQLEAQEQIAMTINEVRDALVAGEGETVCANLTEQGQRVMVRIAKDQKLDAETCEAAAGQLAGFMRLRPEDPAEQDPYTAADIDVDPTDDPGFNDVTDTVGGMFSVEVACKDGDGNSYFAVREGDEWRLTVPFCSGR